AEQDLAMLRVPAELHHTALDVGEIGRRIQRPRLDGENGVRIPGSEVPSLARSTRLQDRWTVLRRTHNVERAARLEEAPHVLLARVGEDRPLAVHHPRAHLPARPQPATNLHVLVRAFIADPGIRTSGAEVGVEVPVE